MPPYLVSKKWIYNEGNLVLQAGRLGRPILNRLLCINDQSATRVFLAFVTRSQIMDEIHLLGEDRGPVLEVIVSRMRYIAASTARRTNGSSLRQVNET